MLSLEQAAGFLLAAVMVTAAPGPDNLMVLSLGMAQGRARGVAFGLGCALGCLSHTALAALGVGALIAASPTAFTALRVLGGAYLVVLGVQAWRSARSLPLGLAEGASPPSLGAVFVKGLLANTVNPKVLLFYLSFLPQFVDTSRGGVAGQTGLLGLIFTVQAALVFGLVGLASGAIGQALQGRPGAGRWMQRIAGTVFVALGLKLLIPF